MCLYLQRPCPLHVFSYFLSISLCLGHLGANLWPVSLSLLLAACHKVLQVCASDWGARRGKQSHAGQRGQRWTG